MPSVADNLKALNLTLPTPAAPVAAYVPYVISGKTVYISGQLPLENGQVKITGRLGESVEIAQGQEAAKLCALNILAHLEKACGGDWTKVERCVKLGGFISSTDKFYDQPQVMNGASELMEKVFGEAGKHARFAVGVGSLPKNAAVEVDAIFSLK
ncbi:MAG TPA: RidA family protein [Alphaproteobacteria bacterium]|nr:RidA family protein [Alphaproteobacteria bacterium]